MNTVVLFWIHVTGVGSINNPAPNGHDLVRLYRIDSLIGSATRDNIVLIAYCSENPIVVGINTLDDQLECHRVSNKSGSSHKRVNSKYVCKLYGSRSSSSSRTWILC